MFISNWVFGAWRCQRTMELLALPNPKQVLCIRPRKVPNRSVFTESLYIFFELQILTAQEVKKKKKYWLSVYAMKFSSISILTRVPGNSAIQGAQLRRNSCFPPRRQSAWELRQFVRVHQALTLPNSNK